MGYSQTCVDGVYGCFFALSFAMLCGDGPTARQQLSQAGSLRTLVTLGDRATAEMATARADAVDAVPGSLAHALRADAAHNPVLLAREQPGWNLVGVAAEGLPNLVGRRVSPAATSPASAVCDRGELFKNIVEKSWPAASAQQRKLAVKLAFAIFLRLVATEEQTTPELVSAELRDASFGLKAMVPSKWRDLAVAAAEQAQEPLPSAFPVADRLRNDLPTSDAAPSKKRKQPFVAEDDHGLAKDAANAVWIGLLRRGGKIFFLDSWGAVVGLKLRTLKALLLAGHAADNLYSANPDGAICEQLRRERVTAHHGEWSTFHTEHKFDGVYLDLCSGSEAYVRTQLELATVRASSGCVCGFTLTARDFNGEPLLLRAMALADFMAILGWKPAMQQLRPSTLLHRSAGSHQQVLTQFWTKQ
jgi:hypothetical protein